MRTKAFSAVIGAAVFSVAVVAAERGEGQAPASIYDITVNRIDGTPESLGDYKGKVLLIVNVASRCGLTPQYEGLQSLHESLEARGFAVLGFPANDFGRQEPGTNSEIAEFCTGRFGVTFPMFEKVIVTGDERHPLYGLLASQPSPIGGDPRWNFTKFLVDRTGRVVGRFEPKVRPDDPTLVKQIEGLLAESP